MRQAQRVEIVEAAIRKEAWTEDLVVRLIKDTGSSRASIYRDRQLVLARLAEEEAAGLPERRAAFLLDLRRVREDALGKRDFTAGVRCLAMEGKVLGLDEAPLPEVEEEQPAQVDTSLEGVLAEVRRLRKRAMAGNSYVAAEKLLGREHELVIAIQQREEADRQRQQEHLTEDELVELVIGSLASLPDLLRRRLSEALAALDR